ncbi:hypothetical protein E2C01_079950 [Portunus trituberculatus]|uniref:Uncharacterized protein n=1 Tax=Portunus trituberculatus TaxID=210409 RepID=A0A5B7IUP4_PORTR|nr:hypothetical protein [Portunus trituberculatus]
MKIRECDVIFVYSDVTAPSVRVGVSPADQPEVRQEGQEATTLVSRFNQLQEERVLTYRRLEE